MSCSCTSFGSFIGNLNCPTFPLPNLGLPCPPLTTAGTADSSTIIYTGPNLSCSGILTNDTVQTALGKIDAQICTSLGNISTYNSHCIAPITTWQQFVEASTAYFCTTQTSLTTFTTGVFPAYQTTVSAALSAITNPSLSLCASSGILIGDSLNTILTKLSSSVCDIYNNKISLAGINWSQCFVVGTAPTSISQGFTTLIGQICQLNTFIQTSGIGGTLPTFNTTGSCLPAGTASDPLVSVVNKLIIRTCQAPTFDINALTWGCVTKPSIVTTDLQGAFGSLLANVTALNQNFPSLYSSDFVVTNIDNSQPCLGKHVALATQFTQDRFVAASPADVSPGTLQDKIAAGSNITLDYFATVGKVTINATGGGLQSNKVASDITDPAPDYLAAKIGGGPAVFGISIIPSLDVVDHLALLNISIDPNALVNALFNAISSNPALLSAFCNLVNTCPSPCGAPTNVTVTYSSSGSSTTTTTTT
jgi:hypothetical protein